MADEMKMEKEKYFSDLKEGKFRDNIDARARAW
jgi:hypothetical protein